MARGWESKSVESQIEDAERREKGAPMTQQERDRRIQREHLLLERSRILAEMEAARHPRLKALLQPALAHLNARLAELEAQ